MARADDEQLELDQLHDRPQRALAPRQRRAARRRGAHRALLDRLGHEARDGGRDRAGRRSCASTRDVPTALAAYEEERRPLVESTQRAARPAAQWFEDLRRYVHQDPRQFVVQPAHAQPRGSPTTTCGCATTGVRATRSTTGSHEAQREVGAPEPPSPRPPMFMPFRLRALQLQNRVVVSPMDMYSAVTATSDDFHLVHLGARALGGAGLVMTEMACVSPEGRITPGCAGHVRGRRRSRRGAHRRFRARAQTARIGLQLGHSGARAPRS